MSFARAYPTFIVQWLFDSPFKIICISMEDRGREREKKKFYKKHIYEKKISDEL